ncbi:MAG: HEAT repeat domain-containing protein, partial [Thermodesulfovibrionales bacterium]
EKVRDAAPGAKGGGRQRKERVRELLAMRSLEEITLLALQDRGVIRLLISLSYDREDVLTWRAGEALGSISRAFAHDRVEVIRDTIRRLLWSMGEESGGIGWSAAEALGEIVAGNPDGLADIVPLIWSFREEEMFRAGILWAMGRIASVRPGLVRFILEELPFFLGDPNPAVRGYAVWVLGILEKEGVRGQVGALRDDPALVPFYRDGDLVTRTVGEIAAEALH